MPDYAHGPWRVHMRGPVIVWLSRLIWETRTCSITRSRNSQVGTPTRMSETSPDWNRRPRRDKSRFSEDCEKFRFREQLVNGDRQPSTYLGGALAPRVPLSRCQESVGSCALPRLGADRRAVFSSEHVEAGRPRPA